MFRGLGTDSREAAREPALERRPLTPERDPHTSLSRAREAVAGRGCTYRISEAEARALFEIGRFRTVALEDLLKEPYRGDAAAMRQDLKELSAQGLVQRRTAYPDQKSRRLAVVVLTRAGKHLVEQSRVPRAARQAMYAGFVKPSEVAHDAAIYRMFQAERTLIERVGGRIQRIVLDYELKRRVYSPLAKARSLPEPEYAKRQAAVAREHHLTVVKGRIVLPDLRIEYETRTGDLARVDLELATHHYHASHMSAKAQAGFRFYAPSESAARLSRAMEERDITVDILSL